MKNRNGKKRTYLLLVLILCLMALLMVYSISSMKKDYFDSIGRRAMGFSLVTSDKLQLSNAEVDRLTGLNFDQLLKDDTNVTFENYTRKFMRPSDVKYVYLLHQLNAEQVKYSVEKDDEETFELPAGTKLDTIYLIDSVIDEKTRSEDTDYKGYTDKDRYTHLDDKIQAIYDNREAAYIIYQDKWGTYISGFTPLYSTQGDFIGMLGADIFVDEYVQLLIHRIVVLVMFYLMILILIVAMLRGYRKIFTIESVMDNLKSKVNYDEVTGLYNRSMLKEQQKIYSNYSIEENTTVAALMMDIDCFKGINDNYGHLKGDELIISVSDIIKSVLEGNGQPFRYGGDEFMIILVNRELSQVKSIAEEIRRKVQEINIQRVEEKITVSIGIAFKQINNKADFKTLLTKADEMMYQSKGKGGNSISEYLL
ncbi:MAG: GGDEF domain-containing protein [Solirubrobacterales bacterium]